MAIFHIIRRCTLVTAWICGYFPVGNPWNTNSSSFNFHFCRPIVLISILISAVLTLLCSDFFYFAWKPLSESTDSSLGFKIVYFVLLFWFPTLDFAFRLMGFLYSDKITSFIKMLECIEEYYKNSCHSFCLCKVSKGQVKTGTGKKNRSPSTKNIISETETSRTAKHEYKFLLALFLLAIFLQFSAYMQAMLQFYSTNPTSDLPHSFIFNPDYPSMRLICLIIYDLSACISSILIPSFAVVLGCHFLQVYETTCEIVEQEIVHLTQSKSKFTRLDLDLQRLAGISVCRKNSDVVLSRCVVGLNDDEDDDYGTGNSEWALNMMSNLKKLQWCGRICNEVVGTYASLLVIQSCVFAVCCLHTVIWSVEGVSGNFLGTACGFVYLLLVTHLGNMMDVQMRSRKQRILNAITEMELTQIGFSKNEDEIVDERFLDVEDEEKETMYPKSNKTDQVKDEKKLKIGEIKLLAQCILKWDWKLTAKNMFNVNHSVIPRVLGTILSYTIFIFQLEVSEQHAKKFNVQNSTNF